MTKRFGLLVVLIGMILMACNRDTAEITGEKFGQGVTLAQAMPVNEVFNHAADLNGQVVRISGTISDMCKHKGCWMQVKDGDQVLTVRFKDEAFTLPLESAGRKVDFEGLLIAEKVANPLGTHEACAEGGEHKTGETCENERGTPAARQASDLRYTMISTGLVLL